MAEAADFSKQERYKMNKKAHTVKNHRITGKK
jgi:hypothetical protein